MHDRSDAMRSNYLLRLEVLDLGSLRSKISDGRSVLGCLIPIPSPDIVEMCALAGFDFVVIDAEHGRISPGDGYSMVLAGETRGIDVLARVGEKDPKVTLKFLDLGVKGVMVPGIVSDRDGRDALDALKFSPLGSRGMGGGRIFDFGVRGPASQHVRRLNEEMLSVLQFETVAALPDLDKILELRGLDYLVIGPNDLAQSMGLPGQPNHADVVAISEEVLDRATRAEVAVGITVNSSEAALKAVQRGYRILLCSVQSIFIQGGLGIVDALTGHKSR